MVVGLILRGNVDVPRVCQYMSISMEKMQSLGWSHGGHYCIVAKLRMGDFHTVKSECARNFMCKAQVQCWC
jgi:hypothetical protein